MIALGKDALSRDTEKTKQKQRKNAGEILGMSFKFFLIFFSPRGVNRSMLLNRQVTIVHLLRRFVGMRFSFQFVNFSVRIYLLFFFSVSVFNSHISIVIIFAG